MTLVIYLMKLLYTKKKSAQLAREFLKEYIPDDDLLNSIEECIMATKANVKPANLLQQILVDADTYNFGTKEIETTNSQVYDEHVNRNGYLSNYLRCSKTTITTQAIVKNYLWTEKKKNIKKLKKGN